MQISDAACGCAPEHQEELSQSGTLFAASSMYKSCGRATARSCNLWVAGKGSRIEVLMSFLVTGYIMLGLRDSLVA